MTKPELAKLVSNANCKVLGSEDIYFTGERKTLAAFMRAFNYSESYFLCEPSLARKRNRRPDIVLIDVEIGVCIIEVKGMSLEKIEAIEAGGIIQLRYGSGYRSENPVNQAYRAMFDIKDATKEAFGGDVQVRFNYRVVFPEITRDDWHSRFGPHAFCPAEFLFADDLNPEGLARSLSATSRNDSTAAIRMCPLDQLQCVWRAFGDTSVLYWAPETRLPRPAVSGTLGHQFDEAAEAYKSLSPDQQKLSTADWREGPRLVRGVAGSGKTIVLANNLARRLERMLREADENLMSQSKVKPRLLAVCFNRKLAPLLQHKIAIAFEQRTGQKLPRKCIDVCCFNALMYRLHKAGLWTYQKITNRGEASRAQQYLQQLDAFRRANPDRFAALAYDAIYVDEGQDLVEQEFELLKQLCRTPEGAEPNLYVFYDDAQNVFGRARPNWASLGLNMRGARATVMTRSFRNTRPIVEASFNVLYGSYFINGEIPSKEFGDIAYLEKNGLIKKDNGHWRTPFAVRSGAAPLIAAFERRGEETEDIVGRLRWLVEEQHVRPEDILVLAYTNRRVNELARAIKAAEIPGLDGAHIACTAGNKDSLLTEPGKITVSTIASAKGYDAYCVLIASADEIPANIAGRATFYVACTRAIEYLEVFSSGMIGLAMEMMPATLNLDDTDHSSPLTK